MTEDEAKTKWCVFMNKRIVVRQGYVGLGPHNEAVAVPPELDTDHRCIGSECMMWRHGVRIENTGYCGIAGKP